MVKSDYKAYGIELIKSTHFLPNIAIGAGIDFGTSNLIILTPLVSYRYGLAPATGIAARGTCAICEGGDGQLRQFQAGIRIGIRLDRGK